MIQTVNMIGIVNRSSTTGSVSRRRGGAGGMRLDIDGIRSEKDVESDGYKNNDKNSNKTSNTNDSNSDKQHTKPTG